MAVTAKESSSSFDCAVCLCEICEMDKLRLLPTQRRSSFLATHLHFTIHNWIYKVNEDINTLPWKEDDCETKKESTGLREEEQ